MEDTGGNNVLPDERMSVPAEADTASIAIQRALEAMRAHLNLDVAFVSQIRDGRRVFQFVDARDEDCPVEVGGSDPVEDSYCHYVISGQMPQLLGDPSRHPIASRMAATHELPVGTHISVPIELNDGHVYGTFCCFSYDVRDGVDERDLAAVRMLSRVIAGYIEDREAARRDAEARRVRIRTITAGEDLTMVFQPIVRLGDGVPVGYEALARFPHHDQGPATLFADAWDLGLGIELEMKAVRAALREFPRLPARTYMTINAAPMTLASAEFDKALTSDQIDPARVVVEVTEHAAIDDYDALLLALTRMTTSGVRLAIDDVGTGFSGLRHIVRLSPQIIKVDADLVRNIDAIAAKQAMISALVTFASRTNVAVVAEGIETRAELEALKVLGVELGQGYHIDRPDVLPNKATPIGKGRPAMPASAEERLRDVASHA